MPWRGNGVSELARPATTQSANSNGTRRTSASGFTPPRLCAFEPPGLPRRRRWQLRGTSAAFARGALAEILRERAEAGLRANLREERVPGRGRDERFAFAHGPAQLVQRPHRFAEAGIGDGARIARACT